MVMSRNSRLTKGLAKVRRCCGAVSASSAETSPRSTAATSSSHSRWWLRTSAIASPPAETAEPAEARVVRPTRRGSRTSALARCNASPAPILKAAGSGRKRSCSASASAAMASPESCSRCDAQHRTGSPMAPSSPPSMSTTASPALRRCTPAKWTTSSPASEITSATSGSGDGAPSTMKSHVRDIT